MKKLMTAKTIPLQEAIQQFKFQDLTLFETVARHVSLSAAARELGLRAPFLTKAIQRMESLLKVQLFTRTASGISLTPDGADFLNACKNLIGAVEQTRWPHAAPSLQQPYLLSIAAPLFLQAHLVAPSAANALQNEGLGLRLIDMLNSQMLVTSTREHIEAAVHCGELDWGKSWNSYPVGTIEWALCARLHHPLGRRVSERDVLQYPFIVPASLTINGFRTGDDGCPATLKQRVRMYEVSNGEIGIRLLKHTDALIYFPKIQLKEWEGDQFMRVVEVKDWKPVRKSVFLSVHQDRIKEKWLRSLLNALENGLKG